MSDNANDKRIEEAAEHYHPVYDDEAWGKMEHLLNQHLPLKKKRRKLIYFLLPIILAGGVILFFIMENNRTAHVPGQQTITSSAKIVKQNPEPLYPNSPDAIDKNSSTDNTIASREIPKIKKASSAFSLPDTRNNSIGDSPTATLSIREKRQKNDLTKPKQNSTAKEEIEVRQEISANINPIVESKVNVNPSTTSSTVVLNQHGKDKNDSTINETSVVKSDNNKHINKEASNLLKPKKEIKKSKNNFSERFGISVSVGPDLSGVRLNNPGKVAMNFGFGVSYNISPSFTLRTGLYTAKKIYFAEPLDYKTTEGPGNYYYLENIDANCLVYSIPVNISYHFKKVNNHNWFISTGLSSYIMKRESYDYHYKYPSGQTSTKNWTIHNENKNLFSVLNLSGGYQHFFNNRTSIMAEPYIDIPLSGVGAGKVKLKSTGILFTFSVKPFLKRK